MIESEDNEIPVRVQKLLANLGLGSRRQIEAMIREGRILLNGVTACLGDKACSSDRLHLDGQEVYMRDRKSLPQKLLMYYKPEGEVCTRTDPQGRATVFDRLPVLEGQRWVVIGRLDMNTTGLLLFTTDGDFANQVMHPSSQIEREYLCRIYGRISDESIASLCEGVELDDGLAKFERLALVGSEDSQHLADSGVIAEPNCSVEAANKWYTVVLNEGRNREVRRMWAAVGGEVSKLKRVRFGHFHLPDNLSPKQWLEVDSAEMALLQEQIGVKLKKRTGLYGRPKVRLQIDATTDDGQDKKSRFLRRRRP